MRVCKGAFALFLFFLFLFVVLFSLSSFGVALCLFSGIVFFALPFPFLLSEARKFEVFPYSIYTRYLKVFLFFSFCCILLVRFVFCFLPKISSIFGAL